jgi:predicted amidophosphoribosyltransferase
MWPVWAILGLIFSIVTLVVIAVLPRTDEARTGICPYCRSMIPALASVCARCGREVKVTAV